MKIDKALLAIVVFAIMLRIVGLASVPPSLNWDEVSHGYNAYSILESGKDEWGAPLPIIFRAFGDYKLPVYIYLTSLFEVAFGLSVYAVRLPSVLSGVILVIATHYITLHLTKSKKIALLSALLMSISPWGLFVSRIAVESNLALALTISGLYLLLSGAKTNYWKLVWGSVLMGLSVWTYNAARIFVPLLILGIAVIYFRELKKIWSHNRNRLLVLAGVLLLFIVPMFLQLVSTSGQARYSKLSIINEGSIAEIESLRNGSELSPLFSALLYNKATYFALTFAKNYIASFGPQFLFFSGGDNYQFSIPEHGLLYPVTMPFILIGLVWAVRNAKKNKHLRLLLVWGCLAPVAGSLTLGFPHVLRNLSFLPVAVILSSIGLCQVALFVRKRTQRIYYTVVVVILLLSLGRYLNIYANDYRKSYSQAWQYGYKEVIDYAMNHYSEYDRIIITKKYGEPHEFLLFYALWDPIAYREDENLLRFNQSGWYWVDKFDKFYFMNDWQVPNSSSDKWLLESKGTVPMDGNVLLVASPDNYPKDWHMLSKVSFLDGTDAFIILSNK